VVVLAVAVVVVVVVYKMILSSLLVLPPQIVPMDKLDRKAMHTTLFLPLPRSTSQRAQKPRRFSESTAMSRRSWMTPENAILDVTQRASRLEPCAVTGPAILKVNAHATN
jgi:hypothetical protein